MGGLTASGWQEAAVFGSLPGGPLTWSLVLAFAAVVLAVLGLAAAAPAEGLRRRLGMPAATTGARLARPAPRRRWAWRRARHREALRLGFPDALDMMVLCAEAGLGLDAALNRVAAEIAPAHPAMGAELARIGRELRAGKERAAVLRGFARRAGLPEVESFATLLLQSEALGTGIARTLRVQAEEMRAMRLLRAEERAHTLPVKLTLPLVVCVLPAMIVVVLLPGALTIVRDVLPNLGH